MTQDNKLRSMWKVEVPGSSTKTNTIYVEAETEAELKDVVENLQNTRIISSVHLGLVEWP